MDDTIARFRTRMVAANRAFLNTRVEQRNQRDASNGDGPVDDVAALLHHPHMDGTASPPSEAVRGTFLRAFEDLINDLVDDDVLDSGDDDERILLPDELGEFLKLTSGAYDPDFRQSGICNFAPLGNLIDCSDESIMYVNLKFRAQPEQWESEGVWGLDDKLEVAAGLLVDAAGDWPDDYDPECNKWFSILAYCRPVPDLFDQVEEPEPEPWAWRIVFYCRNSDIDYDLHLFEAFGAFLDWYSSWDERLGDNVTGEASGSTHSGNEYAQFAPGEGQVQPGPA